MSRVLVAEKLEFEFDDSWSVLEWDKHDAYQRGIRRMDECSAADFCGIRERRLYLIEVTDYRGAAIEKRQRVRDGSTEGLAHEVACKVRDTVAGLVGARRIRHTEEHIWRPIVDALASMDCSVQVLLWFEEDFPGDPVALQTLQDNIKKKLRWLTTHVLVSCRRNVRSIPPGVTVRSLPGAGQPSAP